MILRIESQIRALRLLRVAALAGAAVIAGGAAGCASMRPALTPPERGGPPWATVATPHIRLTTDLPRPQAVALAKWAEKDWAAVVQGFRFTTGIGSAAVAEPLEVVAFERPADFHAFALPHIDGAFIEQRLGPDLIRRIVLPADDTDEMREVLRHELTHRLVRMALPRAPIWLDEGLAEYLQTLRQQGDQLRLGEPPAEFGFDLDGRLFAAGRSAYWGYVEGAAIPPLPALLAATGQQFMAARGAQGFSLHAGAWLLVRSMAVGAASEALRTYVALLLDRKPLPEAWARAFGDPSLREADYRSTYLRPGERVTARWQDPDGVEPRVEELSPAAVHTEWALLHALVPAHAAQAAEEVNRALAANPDSADAHCLAALIDSNTARALEHAERANTLAPNVARHPIVLASLLQRTLGDGGRIAALYRAAAAASPTPDQAATVGDFHFKAGRLDEAVPLANSALKADPKCIRCLVLRLELANAAHDNDLALDLIDRLLAVIPDEKMAAQLRQIARQLRR